MATRSSGQLLVPRGIVVGLVFEKFFSTNYLQQQIQHHITINASILIHQRPLQIPTQIPKILDSHAQPHQRIADAELLAAGNGDGGVRHDGGMVHQAFNTTERFGQGEQLGLLAETLGCVEAALEDDGDDAAEAGHLAFREHMLRVRGQAG